MDLNNSDARPMLRLIAILLSALVLLQIYASAISFQKDRLEARRAAEYSQRVQNAEALVARQRDGISELLESYQKSAYQNSEVTTIMQQQLLATEHVLMGVQLLALESGQVLELMAANP